MKNSIWTGVGAGSQLHVFVCLFSSNEIHKQIPLAPGRKVALAL